MENNLILDTFFYGTFIIQSLEEFEKKYDTYLNLFAKYEIPTIYIQSKDYRIAEVLESISYQINKNFYFTIIDDFEMKDRSYIDADKFKNVNIIVPLTYATWGIKFNDKLSISTLILKLNNEDYINCVDITNEFLTKEVLIECERIAEMISSLDNINDLEKVIIVSNYLQRYVQFTYGYETGMEDKFAYITSDFKDKGYSEEDVYMIKSSLLENFGLCSSIGNATTLLLNNPFLKVDTRSIESQDHLWNIVKINEKYYFMDNAWNISRNDHKIPGALKAKRFSNKYLLFGLKKAKKISHHDSENLISNIESENYDIEKIEYELEYLKDKGVIFNYSNTLTFTSYKLTYHPRF